MDPAHKTGRKNPLVNKVWVSYVPLKLTHLEKNNSEKTDFLLSNENIVPDWVKLGGDLNGFETPLSGL